MSELNRPEPTEILGCPGSLKCHLHNFARILCDWERRPFRHCQRRHGVSGRIKSWLSDSPSLSEHLTKLLRYRRCARWSILAVRGHARFKAVNHFEGHSFCNETFLPTRTAWSFSR